ncbi:MAG: flippase [archaeon]|nr:flippase [archaeon]
MPKKILANSFFLAASNAASSLCFFLLLIILARILGQEALGQYGVAMAAAAIAASLTELGLDGLAVRESSRDISQTAKYAKHSAIIRCVAGTAIFLPPLIATIFFWQSAAAIFALMAIAYALLRAISYSFKAAFRGHEKMQYEAIPTTVGAVVVLLGGAIAIFFWQSIVALGIALVVAGLVELAIVLAYYRKKLWQKTAFDKVFAKKMLIGAAPFWLSGILLSVYFAADIFMISFFLGDGPTGAYSAAYRPLLAMLAIAAPISLAAYPKISAVAHDKKKLLGTILGIYPILLAAGIVLAIASGGFPRELTQILYGAGFSQTALVFGILWPLPILVCINFLLSATLGATNMQGKNLAIIAIAVALNVAANYYFIQEFGIAGAAYATLLSQLLYLFFACAIIAKYILGLKNQAARGA